MPRPRKWRRVCDLPSNNKFGPLGTQSEGNNCIVMTVDEYETIRLIDYEGLTQEECSKNMDIARTTVTGIYNEARKKIATSLVEGRAVVIQGGEYRLCDGQGPHCKRGGCRRGRCLREV